MIILEAKTIFCHHRQHYSLYNNFLCSNSRRTLFLLKLGSFQFAVLKIVFTILSIVLYTNGTFDLSDVSSECFVAIACVNVSLVTVRASYFPRCLLLNESSSFLRMSECQCYLLLTCNCRSWKVRN